MWVRHRTKVWQPARVCSTSPLVVTTEFCEEVNEEEYDIEILTNSGQEEILQRNVPKSEAHVTGDKGDNAIVSDLILLPHLNEAAILNVLRLRYDNDNIYTATGPIIIAVNPFKRMKIYGQQIMKDYLPDIKVANQGISNQQLLPPHVFGVARAAFVSMRNSQKGHQNQSVLISGESGAGKTVSTKHVMQYLATAGAILGQGSVSKASKKKPAAKASGSSWEGIAQQILQSNPILEAFGNARTLRNDNSSRFGKFIKMRFDDQGTLVGASIQTYLLEKVRLVQQAHGERNYHIFYQMAAGASEEESELWQVFPLEGCKYTNQSDCYERADGVDDAEEWNYTRQAMDVMGFTPEEQNSLFTTTSALMHLSCVEFISLSKGFKSGEEGCRIGLYEAAAAAASLIEVSSDDMETVLCSRTIEAGGQKHIVPNSKERAEFARDAMAKCIYGKMFNWIVQRINQAIQTTSKRAGSFIGILDIFGFEVFQTNSFEQLCINYANESLQQQFNQFMFKLEQNIYEKEGIDWSFINFPDNAECLSLIEKSRTGIIALLDETCIFPKGTDPMFARKLYQNCTENSNFVATKKNVVDNQFVIRHYAGEVTYNTEGFCDKNKDKLHQDIMDLLKMAGLPLIRTLFSDEFANIELNLTQTPTKNSSTKSRTPGSGRRRSSRYSSVSAISTGSQFKSQLGALMATINETAPHYIRCIKPNDENEPESFHPQRIVAQLRYGGVLQAVQVARAGYPCRLRHKDFISTYRMLCPVKRRCKPKDACVRIIEKMNLPGDDAQVGKTKVFMRRSTFEALESARRLGVEKAATLLQAHFRRYAQEEKYLQIRDATLIICCFARGLKAKSIVRSMRERRASTKIQSVYRKSKERQKYLHFLRSVILTQSLNRIRKANRKCRSLRLIRSSFVLQKQFRMRRVRRVFLEQRNAVNKIASAVRIMNAKELRRMLYREAKEVGSLQKQLAKMKEQLKDADGGKRMTDEVQTLTEKLDAEIKSKTKVQADLAGHMDKCRRLEHEIIRLRKELDAVRQALTSEKDEEISLIREELIKERQLRESAEKRVIEFESRHLLDESKSRPKEVLLVHNLPEKDSGDVAAGSKLHVDTKINIPQEKGPGEEKDYIEAYKDRLIELENENENFRTLVEKMTSEKVRLKDDMDSLLKKQNNMVQAIESELLQKKMRKMELESRTQVNSVDAGAINATLDPIDDLEKINMVDNLRNELTNLKQKLLASKTSLAQSREKAKEDAINYKVSMEKKWREIVKQQQEEWSKGVGTKASDLIIRITDLNLEINNLKAKYAQREKLEQNLDEDRGDLIQKIAALNAEVASLKQHLVEVKKQAEQDALIHKESKKKKAEETLTHKQEELSKSAAPDFIKTITGLNLEIDKLKAQLESYQNSDEIEINDGKKSKTVAKLRGKLSKEKAAAEEGKQELQRKIDTLNAKRTEESEKLQSLQEQVEKLLLEKKMDHEKVNAFESVKSEIAKLVEEKGRMPSPAPTTQLSGSTPRSFEADGAHQKLLEVTALLDGAMERNHKLRELHELSSEKELESRRLILQLETKEMDLQREIVKLNNRIRELQDLYSETTSKISEEDTFVDKWKESEMSRKQTEEEYQTLFEEFEAAKKNIIKLEKRLKEVQDTKNREMDDQSRSNTNEIQMLKNGLTQNEDELKKMQEAHKRLISQLELNKNTIIGMRASSGKLRDDNANLEKELSEARKLQETYRGQEKLRDDLVRVLQSRETTLTAKIEEYKTKELQALLKSKEEKYEKKSIGEVDGKDEPFEDSEEFNYISGLQTELSNLKDANTAYSEKVNLLEQQCQTLKASEIHRQNELESVQKQNKALHLENYERSEELLDRDKQKGVGKKEVEQQKKLAAMEKELEEKLRNAATMQGELDVLTETETELQEQVHDLEEQVTELEDVRTEQNSVIEELVQKYDALVEKQMNLENEQEDVHLESEENHRHALEMEHENEILREKIEDLKDKVAEIESKSEAHKELQLRNEEHEAEITKLSAKLERSKRKAESYKNLQKKLSKKNTELSRENKQLNIMVEDIRKRDEGAVTTSGGDDSSA